MQDLPLSKRPRRGKLKNRFKVYKEIRSEKPKKQIPRNAVPSFFTLMNLLCGFAAIVQASEGNIKAAAWLIAIAGLFDLLDGMIARIAKATSEFGGELDSLCDIVSFGVAPAFLLYVTSLQTLNPPFIGLVIAALPAICGAIRLARFNLNISEEKSLYFNGLPIPAQALATISFVLSFEQFNFNQWFKNGEYSVVIPAVIILSGLMVSTIPFPSIPKPSIQSFREHPRLWFGYALAVPVILIWQEVGLFCVMGSYLVLSTLVTGFKTLQAVWTQTEPLENN